MSGSFAATVDRERVEQRLVRYVGTQSVNTAFSGGAGEARLASVVAADLRRLGLEPVREPVGVDGRDNVVARLACAPGSPVVMFHAHMDTVGLSGKATADPVVVDGNVHGRGACDTKGSLVAAIEALDRLRSTPQEERATVLFVAGVDEEAGATGAAALVHSHPEIDMAVVGEPTGLEMATAHKGVLRFEIRAGGVPAHSSKPHLGVNAIYVMAAVVDALRARYLPSLDGLRHPLVGSPTMSVTTIRGGTGLNVVPAECTVGIDRRLIPGELAEDVLAALDAILGDAPGETGIERLAPSLVTAPLDTPVDHPVVQALGRARERIVGSFGEPIGVTYGTDGSVFAPAGIACVVFGPGSIDQAHSDEEWVSIEETAQAAEILAHVAVELAR